MKTDTSKPFSTIPLKPELDYPAPDGSEIRLLAEVKGGGLAHCRLPSGIFSAAVRHKTVDEIWYFLSGAGEVWRKFGDFEEVTAVSPGVSLNIPVGTHFQFRNTGQEPLEFVIATIPPWPGRHEAVTVDGKWKPGE
jgi:mannose-6-phosphate isomerase-like protein (cupin superfamily)